MGQAPGRFIFVLPAGSTSASGSEWQLFLRSQEWQKEMPTIALTELSCHGWERLPQLRFLQLRVHSLSVGFFSSGNLFLPEQCLPVHYCSLRLPDCQSSVLAICLSVRWLEASSGDEGELCRSWTRFTSQLLQVVWGCDGCSSPLTRWVISSHQLIWVSECSSRYLEDKALCCLLLDFLFIESRNGLCWKKPLKIIWSIPFPPYLPWVGTPSTRPGCSTSYLTWAWTHPWMELLWAVVLLPT